MSNLDEVFQGVPEMTSSIVLTKILATNYTWQEKEALKFLSFVSQLQLLDRWYNLRGRDEVLQFLERHPLLVFLLLEIHGRIGDYLPYSQLSLKIVVDIEASEDDLDTLDDYENVVVFIATHLTPQEAWVT